MDGARTHRRRYAIEGHARYLTFSCFHGRPFFRAERTCLWYLETVAGARQAYPFELWAYVIMPNHCHLLLLPHRPADVPDILRRIKKPLVDRALAWVRTNAPGFLPRMADRQPDGTTCHRFWQRGGGYDRNLFTAQEVHEKIAYIHANPVRAGLVSGPEQWPWSSYRAWAKGVDYPLAIDRQSVPTLVR